jgi:hypothetical protein
LIPSPFSPRKLKQFASSKPVKQKRKHKTLAPNMLKLTQVKTTMEDSMVQDKKNKPHAADRDAARPESMKDQNLSKDRDIASKRDVGSRK